MEPVRDAGLGTQSSEQVPLLPTTKSHTRSIYKLVFYVIISWYALSMSGPAGMDLQYYSICRSLGVDEDQCFTSPLAAQAESVISSYSATIGSVLRLALVPVVMMLAHRFDRKPILIISLFFSVLRHVLMWYLAFFARSSYYWLLVPTVLGTIYSESTELLLIPYICSFAPDTEHRARYIAWVVSASSFSSILGPASGSTLIDFVGLYNFYLIAIGLELLSVVLGVFLLERQGPLETPQEQTAESLEEAAAEGPIKSLGCLLLNHIHDPEERENGRKVITISVLISSCSLAISGVLYLHVKYTFGWSAKEWGLMASALSAVGLVSYSFISPVVISKLRALLGSNEHKYDRVDQITLQYSIWVDAVAFGIIGAFSSSSRIFAAAVVMDGFSVVAAPNNIALICKYAPLGQDGAGKIFASFKLATNSLGLAIPFIVFKAYGLLINYWPALLFLVSSGLFMVFSFFVATIRISSAEHRCGTPV